MSEELKKEIEKKFLCSDKFAQEIETYVQLNSCNYITAVVDYCEENGIDMESIPKLIPKPLKEKIRANAIDLNFMKNSSKAKLPL